MSNSRFFLWLLAAWLLAAIPGTVHSQVLVQLFQPPPNQLKVGDLWRISLTNTTSQSMTVYLFGTVEEVRDGLVVEARTATFTLPPGNRIVSGTEIQPIDAEYHVTRYRDFFIRTGQAPTGNYRVCVVVRLALDDSEVGSDCYDQEVQIITPPILVTPPDESVVEEKLPVFSWLPPAPLKPGQQPRYTLKIVELLGRQTPYDAMQSNPAWFLRDGIRTTVMQFPISSRPFRDGAGYAWKITADDNGFPLGESEIWWFTYKPRPLVDVLDPEVDRDRGRGGDDIDIVPYIGDRKGTGELGRGNWTMDLQQDITRITDIAVGVGPIITYDTTSAAKIPIGVLNELLQKCIGQ